MTTRETTWRERRDRGEIREQIRRGLLTALEDREIELEPGLTRWEAQQRALIRLRIAIEEHERKSVPCVEDFDA